MKSLFHHTMDVAVQDGRYAPRRFTDRQTAALGVLNEWFGRNSRSASGVALKCYTPARTVSFSYRYTIQCVRTGGFDVYENGVLVANEQLPAENVETGRFTYRKQSAGETLIEIVLPSNAEMELWDIDFGDWRPYDASKEPLVLWYGDSITQSTTVTNPSLTFVALASRLAGMDYVNRGIGSLFYDETVLDETDPLQPDTIMVELGANDLVKHGADKKLVFVDDVVQYCTVEDIPKLMDDARAYLEKLKTIYPHANIKVMSMLWECLEKNESRVETLHAYRAGLERLVKELELDFIDGLTLMPHLEMCCVDDRIHLSTIGSMAVAQSLAKVLTRS